VTVARYPQTFVDDVRTAADIVAVVQDVVPLRRVGATYKGLCPFHSEKTPSFHVNRERGFFHCFGCGVGGDVFKFVELQEKVGFLDAVRRLAHRFGVVVPESSEGGRDDAEDAEREAILKMHEIAARWYQEQLRSAAGARAREALGARGLTADTVERLGIGFAPGFREGLKQRLGKQGFTPPQMVRSGLVLQRDDGSQVDRFRHRLMVPICRESGAIIAFGGRALLPDQQPKYLNSPETPVYQKSRTLYGLHVTRQGLREHGRAILVEGYFDFAQVLQAGLATVVASCGTALTVPQAQVLRRFAKTVVLSFDPDAAGQTAAVRSCELLVAEGFDVRVALLPEGDDPDTFVRTHGGAKYAEIVENAPSWLDYLVERAAARHRLERPDERRAFLQEMLEVAAHIPDAAGRDQFADRIAHRARVTEEVVRGEIRKAAVARRTVAAPRWVNGGHELKPAERDLLVGLVLQPREVVRALADLEEADLDGLRSASILRMARADAAGTGPSLLERLSEDDSQLLTGLAARAAAPAPAVECVRALRAIRLHRERADVQREIDRLQEMGADAHAGQIAALWLRKKDLMLRLEALDS
jgi:DNA primase